MNRKQHRSLRAARKGQRRRDKQDRLARQEAIERYDAARAGYSTARHELSIERQNRA